MIEIHHVSFNQILKHTHTEVKWSLLTMSATPKWIKAFIMALICVTLIYILVICEQDTLSCFPQRQKP